MSVLTHIDIFLFNAVQQVRGFSFFLDTLGVFLALYAPYVMGGVVLIWIFLKQSSLKRKTFLISQLLLATALPYMVTTLVRLIVQRPRPFLLFPNFTPLVSVSPYLSSASFPSGHATFLFALALFCHFLDKRIGLLCIIIAALGSLARVFVGVHFVSDIFAGALIGIGGAWLIRRLFRYVSS